MSIDPKELKVETDDEWLDELAKEHARLRELEATLTSPGWKHLDAMFQVKENGFVEQLLRAEDFEGVKAAREVVKFVRWLRNLPLNTIVAADMRAETLAEHIEEGE